MLSGNACVWEGEGRNRRGCTSAACSACSQQGLAHSLNPPSHRTQPSQGSAWQEGNEAVGCLPSGRTAAPLGRSDAANTTHNVGKEGRNGMQHR